MALQLGQFIEIQTKDRVLEQACGYGSGLWLWQEAFVNQKCDALDFRMESVDYLEVNLPGNLNNLIASKAEDFFPNINLPPRP